MAQVHPEPILDQVMAIPASGVLSLKDMDPDFNGDGIVDDNEKQVYDKMLAADLDKDGFLTRVEVFKVISAFHSELKSVSAAGIPIESLNPDTDGDGQIEPWEKEVYDRIVQADTDHSGAISVRNLFDFIRQMSNEVKEAAKGGIPISSLNPDTDGDGKVEKWEMEVFERIKDADEDKSGSINVKELFGVIKGAAESDKAKRMFRNMLFVAVAIITLLIVANFVLVIVANSLTATLAASSTTGAMLSKTTGIAAKTGDTNVPMTPVSSRMRRLRTVGERRMLMMSAVGTSAASFMMGDLATTGQNSIKMSEVETYSPPPPPSLFSADVAEAFVASPSPLPLGRQLDAHESPDPVMSDCFMGTGPCPSPDASAPFEWASVISGTPPPTTGGGMGANAPEGTMVTTSEYTLRELGTMSTKAPPTRRQLREFAEKRRMLKEGGSSSWSPPSPPPPFPSIFDNPNSVFHPSRLLSTPESPHPLVAHHEHRRLSIDASGNTADVSSRADIARDLSHVDPSPSPAAEYMPPVFASPAPDPALLDAATDAFETASAMAALLAEFDDNKQAADIMTAGATPATMALENEKLERRVRRLKEIRSRRKLQSHAHADPSPSPEPVYDTYYDSSPSPNMCIVGEVVTMVVPKGVNASDYAPVYFSVPEFGVCYDQINYRQARTMRRRKLSEVGLTPAHDSRHLDLEDCMVFHCFLGDEECDEPSPIDACLRWNDDGACGDPLCKYAWGSREDHDDEEEVVEEGAKAFGEFYADGTPKVTPKDVEKTAEDIFGEL